MHQDDSRPGADMDIVLSHDGIAPNASVEACEVMPPRVLNKRSANAIDAAVGRRIKHRRIDLAMSLKQLGSLVGVSQPQLHRYERGLTRVAASRLVAIAEALRIPIEALVVTPRDDSHPGADMDIVLSHDGIVPNTSVEACEVMPPRGLNERSANAIDAAVGRRIKHRRIDLAMSLKQLGSLVGVSQPQLYRYERGLTRVAASRLVAIAEALRIPIGALVVTLPVDRPPAYSQERRDTEALLAAFMRIERPRQRAAMIDLARAMTMDRKRRVGAVLP